MGKITRMKLQEIIKDLRFKFILLLIVSSLSSLYSIIDYLLLVSIKETGKLMGIYQYNVFDLIPGDGVISSIELMIFFLVVPVFCFMLFMSIVFELEKRKMEK